MQRAKALAIQLLNNCNAVLCSKSLHVPGSHKIPWCKLQLVAANDGLLLADTLIYYGVSNTKKQLSTESSNTTQPEETGTRSMLQVTTA